jgi:hypothetical protein
MKRLALAGVLAGLAAAVSMAAQTSQAKLWPIAAAPAEMRATIERADLVITNMHSALLRELNDALARGGPGDAIDACHIDVTGATQRLGRSHGIAAGRTSDRLRDPTNAPRPWAADAVKANAGRRVRDVEGFAIDLGDRVGVLRPIAERPMCAGCHGPIDGIGPGVRRVLAERYPADRATGFAVGEIRGWYWVEMPKLLK